MMLMLPCSTAVSCASPATALSESCSHCSLRCAVVFNVDAASLSTLMFAPRWLLAALRRSVTDTGVASSFWFLLLILFAAAVVPARCTILRCRQMLMLSLLSPLVDCCILHLFRCHLPRWLLLLAPPLCRTCDEATPTACCYCTTALIKNISILLASLLAMSKSTPRCDEEGFARTVGGCKNSRIYLEQKLSLLWNILHVYEAYAFLTQITLRKKPAIPGTHWWYQVVEPSIRKESIME